MLGFVWCTLSHYLFPKAIDNQPEKYSYVSAPSPSQVKTRFLIILGKTNIPRSVLNFESGMGKDAKNSPSLLLRISVLQMAKLLLFALLTKCIQCFKQTTYL